MSALPNSGWVGSVVQARHWARCSSSIQARASFSAPIRGLRMSMKSARELFRKFSSTETAMNPWLASRRAR